MKKVVFNRVFDEKPAEIFSSKFDHESKLLAIGLGDSRVKVINTSSMSNVHIFPSGVASRGVELPCTSLSWKPKSHDGPILLSGNADGSLMQLQTNTGKKTHHSLEKDNQILTVEYNCLGNHFATAGKDYRVFFTILFESQRTSFMASRMAFLVK